MQQVEPRYWVQDKRTNEQDRASDNSLLGFLGSF